MTKGFTFLLLLFMLAETKFLMRASVVTETSALKVAMNTRSFSPQES